MNGEWRGMVLGWEKFLCMRGCILIDIFFYFFLRERMGRENEKQIREMNNTLSFIVNLSEMTMEYAAR